MFSSPCSHLFPTNINLVAKIILAIVGAWLVSNGPAAIIVFLQTFARDSVCNITFIPVSTWQLYNALFDSSKKKPSSSRIFFHFFYSRGWSLSQDLAVVGILSDCSHVKPTKWLASGLLYSGWGMIPWKQTLKSASISSIRRNIEFISENRHMYILLSKKLFHLLGRNSPPFLIGWWTFENMLWEHFESCPGQSDRSTFEASEQKKWIWSNYFLLPTLLEPKHWILELKHNFPVVLYCIFLHSY